MEDRTGRSYHNGPLYTGRRRGGPYIPETFYLLESGPRILRLGDRYLPLSAESVDFFRNNSELWHTQAPYRYGDGGPYITLQGGSDLHMLAPSRCWDHDYIQSAMECFPDMLWVPRPYSLLAIRSVTVCKLSDDSRYDYDYLHLLTLDALRLGAHHCIRPSEFPLGGCVKPVVILGDLFLDELQVILRAASASYPLMLPC
jgi:hypothetical protein